MKLTNREKFLLPAALFIIAAALFINFIYLPLNKEIKALSVQAEENEFRISEADTKQNAIQNLEGQLAEVQQEFETEHQDVLQEWDQPELMVFIENTINPLCKKTSIDFFDVVSAQAVQAGEINIVFIANYNNLLKILQKFEEAEYYNTITLLDISEPEIADMEAENTEKLLEVSINVRFYSKNQNNNYPEDYSFMDDAYGKTNIFK